MKKFLLPLTSLLFLFVGCEPNSDEIEYGYSARENILSVQNSSGTVAVPFVRKITFTNVTDDGSGAITVATSGGAGTDTTAIHDNEASEITAITEKVTPANDDVFIIEDSAAGNVKKKVKWSSLPGAAGGDSISIDGVAVVDPDFVSTGDVDFIDTSNTVTANINADSITKSMFADEDWGDMSVASNVVSLDNDSVTPNDVLSTGQTDEYCLTYEATGATWEWQACAGGGSGDVTAASNLTDNAIVRGDGGAKGVQESSITIDDNANITIGDGTALDHTLTWDALANDGTFTFDESADDLIWDSNLVVSGDFTVNGTSTTLNTSTVEVEDTNMVLGNVTTPTDLTADGGGISLLGDTNKTILWENDTDSWDFNQIVKTVADFIGVNLDLSGYIDLVEITAPASPAANDGRLYVADDGGTTKLYFKDSAGTATDLLAGGGGTPAGTDGELQYNNGGSFGGTGIYYDDTNDEYIIGATSHSSNDPLFILKKTFNDGSGSGNAHGFVDENTFSRTGGTDAYASFDAKITASGTTNFDHFVGFQSRNALGNTGTTTNYWGHLSIPSTVSTATVTNLSHFAVFGDSSVLGTTTNQYGLKIPNLTAATNNFSIHTGSATTYFGGKVGIGTDDPFSQLHVSGSSAGIFLERITNEPFVALYYGVYTNLKGGQIRGYDNGLKITNAGGGALIATFDSTNNNVGINTSSPGATIDVRGSAIFNEDGGDNDFRVEGDTVTNLLHVDASIDAVGINATPLSTADLAVGGAIAYTPLSAKPENCASGSVGYLYFYTAASGSSLCGCFKTSSSTYAWVTLYSAGAVSCPA